MEKAVQDAKEYDVREYEENGGCACCRADTSSAWTVIAVISRYGASPSVHSWVEKPRKRLRGNPNGAFVCKMKTPTRESAPKPRRPNVVCAPFVGADATNADDLSKALRSAYADCAPLEERSPYPRHLLCLVKTRDTRRASPLGGRDDKALAQTTIQSTLRARELVQRILIV